MANWTDLSAEFTYGQKLTSALMQELRDNITALAEGATGAPEVEAPALSDAAIHTVLPAGCVIASMRDTVPNGFLECDGSAVNRTTYADLFTAIGVIYGNGDGSTTFNIPDLRGEFLRGYDNGAGTDPDAGSRTDRGDTTTGDAVGTGQACGIESHTHAGTYYKNVPAGLGQTAGGTWGASAIDSTGGNETRPVNVSVMYCIRY